MEISITSTLLIGNEELSSGLVIILNETMKAIYRYSAEQTSLTLVYPLENMDMPAGEEPINRIHLPSEPEETQLLPVFKYDSKSHCCQFARYSNMVAIPVMRE